MLVKFLPILALPFVLSATVSASELADARLQSVSGKVLVNQGKGFGAAADLMVVKAGSRIVVGKDSTATLVFPSDPSGEGCNVELAAATVTNVTGRDMCAAQLSDTRAFVGQPVITPTASDGASDSSAVAVGLGFATLVGAAGIIAIVTNDDDNDTPVSAP
jgi:hypothetical protein